MAGKFARRAKRPLARPLPCPLIQRGEVTMLPLARSDDSCPAMPAHQRAADAMQGPVRAGGFDERGRRRAAAQDRISSLNQITAKCRRPLLPYSGASIAIGVAMA